MNLSDVLTYNFGPLLFPSSKVKYKQSISRKDRTYTNLLNPVKTKPTLVLLYFEQSSYTRYSWPIPSGDPLYLQNKTAQTVRRSKTKNNLIRKES